MLFDRCFALIVCQTAIVRKHTNNTVLIAFPVSLIALPASLIAFSASLIEILASLIEILASLIAFPTHLPHKKAAQTN